ncbi:Putative toxin-antitoxin system toxin component, PIN family (plasmid) [Candidatus Methylocalor cossyra]|uniref:Toxin-antitoxin system toxin component, PIN family n=1 Tax=Candidatus Methylocalor cossyra TaxID=3108543 RepID=A0ABP1CDB7_9GAMM
MFDTNILVAALRSKSGPSRAWMRAALKREVEILASVPLFLEYEAVLKRPEHLLATGLLKTELVDDFLAGLAGVVTPVEVSYLWRPQLTDPGDEMVLEAAVNGRADWIVTYNVRDFAVAARRFKLNIGGPGAVWSRLSEELNDAQK